MSLVFIKYPVLMSLLVCTAIIALAQPQRLGREINNPSYSSVYPSVSGDGKVMVYMTNYSDDGSFVMQLTKYRGGKWQRPEDVAIIGSSKVNNWGGYCLNYDGTAIYFSSRRSNGLGLYDVWYSELVQGEWSVPKNIGKPINSGEHEGNPSISPDGQRMYFMRCSSMSNDDVSGCKLYYSDRNARGWTEAVELPDHINIGNTTSPRILPDNRTLVFASDRSGGKGGVDLWMTKRTGTHWSEPVNIEPVNTAENDYFLSATLRSIAYITMEGEKNGQRAIGEVRLPNAYRLNHVIVSQGTIKDEEGNRLNADIRAFNLTTEEYEYRYRMTSSDEDFVMILPEGAVYDVTYGDSRLEKMYQAERIDATDLVAPRREYPNIVLRNFEAGLNVGLYGIEFEEGSVEMVPESELEIDRLARILQQHNNYNIEIGVYQKEYREDVIMSDEDLTELRIDTTIVYEEPIRIDTLNSNRLDELIKQINEELAATILDTAMANVYMARMTSLIPVQVQKLTSTYHNDRTESQGLKVKSDLVDRGIAFNRINVVGYRDADPPVSFPTGQDRVVVLRILPSEN